MDSSEATGRGKADRVYAQLRADIETAVLPPGRTLPEIEMVQYTGASRTPVREALRRLASEGLVEIEPRRPPIVSRISVRSARALFDYRRILESAAIRLVAHQAKVDTVLRGRLRELRDRFVVLRESSHAPIAIDPELWEMTEAFDRLFASHISNEYLSQAIVDTRVHAKRLRNIAHSERSRIPETIDDHIRMCETLIDGDAEHAAEAISGHLDHVTQAIFRSLIENGDADLLIS